MKPYGKQWAGYAVSPAIFHTPTTWRERFAAMRRKLGAL